MLARAQNRRLFQRNEYVQDIERHQACGNVFCAPSNCDNSLRGYTGSTANARLCIVDRFLIDDVEVAGSLPRFRPREGEHKEVIPRLKHVVGLTNCHDATAVFEPVLKRFYVHVPPKAALLCRRRENAAFWTESRSNASLCLYLGAAVELGYFLAFAAQTASLRARACDGSKTGAAAESTADRPARPSFVPRGTQHGCDAPL
jgi:hypothetical protein